MGIKFSVIIPVHNQELFLGETVESVLGQNYPEFEILLVENGSSDHSLELCRQIARSDSRIRLYESIERGVSQARNLGIAMAEGEYIQFLDGDDWLEPGTLMRLSHLLAGEKWDVLVYGLRKAGEKICCEILPGREGAVCGSIFFENFMEENREGVYGYVGNKVVRRGLLTEWEIRFPWDLTLREDFYFFLQVYQRAGKIFQCREIFYVYRQHPGSLSKSGQVNYLGQFQVLELLGKVLAAKGDYKDLPALAKQRSLLAYGLIQEATGGLQKDWERTLEEIYQHPQWCQDFPVVWDALPTVLVTFLVKVRQKKLLGAWILLLGTFRKWRRRKWEESVSTVMEEVEITAVKPSQDL